MTAKQRRYLLYAAAAFAVWHFVLNRRSPIA
jgi:hypothetical protein